MNKRLVLTALAAASLSPIPLRAAGHPNVLFIAADDLKPMLGCYGDVKVKTPNIDRLAARGTVFLNNQCQQAVCAPSRASLMTGVRADSTGVYDLQTRLRDIHPDILTLPQYFKSQGYETAGIGKIYDPRSVDGQKKDDPASWSIPYLEAYGSGDDVLGFLNPQTIAALKAGDGEEGLKKKRKGKGDGENRLRPPTEGSEDVPDNAYDDGAIADVGVEWIGKLAASEKPFFFGVGFKKPHLPFVAPKKYWDLYDRKDFSVAPNSESPKGAPSFATQPGWELRSGYNVPAEGALPEELQRELIHGYYAAVSYMDAQVGKLLDALEKSGEEDNTIVVLWGDHGWHLGDHGIWCKHTNFEQATRAPLIISDPTQKAKGGRVTSPTEFTDIFPTLCQLAGLERPAQLEGVSLVPLLNDPNARVREVAMSQYPRAEKGTNLMGYTFRNDRYRYTEWRTAKDRKSKGDGPVVARELYDYEKDPLESENLIDQPDYAEARMQLEMLAAAELKKYGIGGSVEAESPR